MMDSDDDIKEASLFLSKLDYEIHKLNLKMIIALKELKETQKECKKTIDILGELNERKELAR